MRLLIVNFGLFTSIDVAESADVLIAIVESVGMFFLDSMDCNCFLVTFESAGTRVLIINLRLLASIG
jgi:hypothetical protein